MPNTTDLLDLLVEWVPEADSPRDPTPFENLSDGQKKAVVIVGVISYSKRTRWGNAWSTTATISRRNSPARKSRQP